MIGPIQADKDFHTIQWNREFEFLKFFVFPPLPGQIMKALRRNIPVQIPQLLGKSIGNRQ